MRVLFVHSNFPGQFIRLAQALKARGDDVRALAATGGRPETDIPITRFTPPPLTDRGNPVTARFETDIGRATAAQHVAQALSGPHHRPPRLRRDDVPPPGLAARARHRLRRELPRQHQLHARLRSHVSAH
jgi:hypothetical protein